MGTVEESFWTRAVAVVRTLMRRPWMLLSWVILAGLVVCAQKVVPQPWSAGVYPVALFVALWIFSRTAPKKG
jgi:hypothetical protein